MIRPSIKATLSESAAILTLDTRSSAFGKPGMCQVYRIANIFAQAYTRNRNSDSYGLRER